MFFWIFWRAQGLEIIKYTFCYVRLVLGMAHQINKHLWHDHNIKVYSEGGDLTRNTAIVLFFVF